ncbi:MAG: helix-turn-helix domain-containing protein [Methylococcales bacterium]|nr:helix-turn-helix domain-containing protein [Methylococcales bacterium]
MPTVALLSIGFSLGAALLLIAGNLPQQLPHRCLAKAAGFLLILALAGLQVLHLHFLLNQFDVFHARLYGLLLYAVAPSFYFYSRQLLVVDSHYQRRDGVHLAPLLISFVLPYDVALPGAFLLGAAYLTWLANVVYRLRAQRQRFQLELLALATLFVIAIAVLLLGFIGPLVDQGHFIQTYSILIGLAFFAVTLTLLRFPSITADVSEAVQAAYAESTLKNIDKAVVLAKLDDLMEHDKLYTLETLNLTLLAEQLGITAHQLSELINTQFQQGFSRYIREHRIAAAKKLLLAEPNASVLSIGLSVGFNSQSNFYAAFRDIADMTPGQYRKNHGES